MSSLGLDGKLMRRMALETQLEMPPLGGSVVTVTPTARPFCTAAHTLTCMLPGAPQALMYEPLLRTDPNWFAVRSACPLGPPTLISSMYRARACSQLMPPERMGIPPG